MWVTISLIIAIITAVIGFGGVAASESWISQILFFVFMIVALATLALGIRNHER